MTIKTPFAEFKGNFEVEQVVEVLYRGGVGVRDRRAVRAITRVTPTQITLSDGERFMKTTGVRGAARSRCERADTIVSIFFA